MFENKSISETCKELNTDKDRGLSQKEVILRLKRDGGNVLTSKRKKTVLSPLLSKQSILHSTLLLRAAM